MTAEQAQVIELYLDTGLSYSEIAASIGVTRNKIAGIV